MEQESLRDSIKAALRELYLVESALQGVIERVPKKHSWELLQVMSDLLAGMKHLEEHPFSIDE